MASASTALSKLKMGCGPPTSTEGRNSGASSGSTSGRGPVEKSKKARERERMAPARLEPEGMVPEA